MIDGFLNTLRKTGERVQRRSEEVTQAARLRLDIFQLNRELDALYARLGRAYHGNAAVSTLEEIRGEISRVDEEITAREHLMAELGRHQESDQEAVPGTSSLDLTKTPDPAAHPASSQAQTALSVWREKEAARMTDTPLETGPLTDATGRPDGETTDPTKTSGGEPYSEVYSGAKDNSSGVTHPNEAGQGDKLQPTPNTASMGNEAGRDEMDRHRYLLEEGKRASENPDPLASKD